MKLCMGCMEQLDENIKICPHCGYAANTPVESPYYLEPGTVLCNRYVVGKTLGHGGFGITYIGYDMMLDRIIAVKEYFPNNLATRSTGTRQLTVYTGEAAKQYRSGLESFISEAKKLAELTNVPEIVNIYDCIMENNTGYIIMELLKGSSVKEILDQKKSFSYEEASDIIQHVLTGLTAIHAKGLIHRDISPDNIIITDEGKIKLIDFGAARHTVSGYSVNLAITLKPGYAPAEQYRSKSPQGTWMDIYAVCATFYRMITGIVPQESMDRLLEDQLQTPSELGVRMPESAERALMKGLAVRREDRIQTAEELKQQLFPESAVPGAGSGKPEDREKNAEDHSGRKKVVAGGVFAISMVVVLFAGILIGQKNSQKKETDSATMQVQKQTEAVTEVESEAIETEAAEMEMVETEAVETEQTETMPMETEPVETEPVETEPVETEPAETEPAETEADTILSIESEEFTETDTIQIVETELISESEEQTEAAREVVVWSDPKLEELIRTGLDRPEGDIYADELAEVTVLEIVEDQVVCWTGSIEDAPVEPEAGAEEWELQELSVEDLKWMPNLQILGIYGWTLSDLDPVSSLEYLTELVVVNGQGIDDISALSGIVNLTELYLYSNNINNISALSGLNNLKTLWLGGNNISDISALSGLSNLSYLNLNGDNITDISALSGLSNLSYLDLYGDNITDISALSGLSNLSYLNLYDNNITDISALSGLSNLSYLNLYDNNITDISVLSGLSNLKTLELRRNNISDISALSGLVNLEKLYLGLNNISDISALSGLSNLSYLNLYDNNITDISVLSGLSNLETLNLIRNNISDISALSGLVNLKELHLDNNNISNIDVLTNLTKLQKVSLTGNPVEDESDSNTDDVEVQDAADESEIAHEVVVWSDPIIEQAVREGLDRPEGDIYADELSEIKILTIAEDQVIRAGTREDDFEYTINTNEEWETKSLSLEDLKWLPNLEDLYIRGYILNDLELIGNLTYLSNLKLENNDLSDISALSSLSNLEVLDLEDNNIRDISALSGLVNLEGLFLIDSNISDISALSGLVNLEGLWLYDNNISDISALSGLSNLRWLYLEENDISDISALSGLSNLDQLWLYDNNIGDISALSGLSNLRGLMLSGNDIRDISVLSSLVNLEVLYLGGSNISNISVLSELSNLEKLDLSDTDISDISALSGLVNLNSLYLDNNNISNIEPLINLPNLQTVSLRGNPVGDVSGLSWVENLYID